MRNAFINTLMKEASKRKQILLLTGDLGYTVFEDFKESYPNQFFNMGVGEANMMGVAAGLAYEKNIPIVYSIIPFITLRCYEQIRNDICSHNVNVKIIGIGSGLGYAHLGISHHSAEDISIMRTLANMVVLSPADPYEVEASLVWALDYNGPVYIRLGKSGEPTVHKSTPNFGKRKVFILKKGSHGHIFCTGTIVPLVIEASKKLEAKGYQVSVISVPFIKPLPKQLIKIIVPNSSIFTVEEHSIIGGLGSSFSEMILENGIKVKQFKRIGIQDAFCRTIGSYDFMRDSMGLSPTKIAAEIIKTLRRKS